MGNSYLDLRRAKATAMKILDTENPFASRYAKFTKATILERRAYDDQSKFRFSSEPDNIMIVPSFMAVSVMHAAKCYDFGSGTYVVILASAFEDSAPASVRAAAGFLVESGNVVFDCRARRTKHLFGVNAKDASFGKWLTYTGPISRNLVAVVHRRQLSEICMNQVAHLFSDSCNTSGSHPYTHQEFPIHLCTRILKEMMCSRRSILLPATKKTKRVAEWRQDVLSRVWFFPENGRREDVEDTITLQKFLDVIKVWEACVMLDKPDMSSFAFLMERHRCATEQEILALIEHMKQNTNVVMTTNALLDGIPYRDLFAGTCVLDNEA